MGGKGLKDEYVSHLWGVFRISKRWGVPGYGILEIFTTLHNFSQHITVDGKMLQRNNVVTLEKMAQRYNIIPLQHFFGVYFCLRDFCWCGGGF